MKSLTQLLVYCVCSLLLLVGSAYSQFTIDEILVTGPTNQRINIVFLAEGYTESELSDFAYDAQTALDYLLSIEPLSSYISYFNAYRINVISNESGSDHPGTAPDCPGSEPVITVDTYFNSSYDSWDIHRLLTIPPNSFDSDPANGRDKVYDLLANLLPEYDIIFIIVNCDMYGGSGGRFAIFSTNQSAVEIAAHEVGHSFVDLDDEYEYGEWGYDDPDIAPNTTKETERENIKWNPWIEPSTPIPTPEDEMMYGTVVGLFEGAHYNPTGWYRPKYDCKMNHLYVPFCEVCQEAWIKEIYSFLNAIVGYEPQQTFLTIEVNESIEFSVDVLVPTGHTLDIEWQLNGNAIPGATGTSYQLNGADLTAGQHTITVVVTDPTDFVMNDPAELLSDTQLWNVEKEEDPDIVLSETDHDFGFVGYGTSSSWVFTILNFGIRNLEVTDVHSDNADFAVNQSSFTVAPYDSQDITVTFTPSDVGVVEGVLTVTSNDPDEPAVEISLAGTGSAALACIPKFCAAPGGTTVVPIDLDSETWIDTPIDNARIELNFDDDLLTVIEVTATSRTDGLSRFEWDVSTPEYLTIEMSDDQGNPIEPGSGAVADIFFAISEDASVGESTRLTFLDVDLKSAQGESLPVMLTGGTIFFGEMVKGDANADCTVNIVDAIGTVNILLGIIVPTSQQMWAADCNGPMGSCDGDGKINVLDTLKIVNLILRLDECP
jgi:hypothetical protein